MAIHFAHIINHLVFNYFLSCGSAFLVSLQISRRFVQPNQATQVAKRFVAGLGLSGIVWGSVAIFLFSRRFSTASNPACLCPVRDGGWCGGNIFFRSSGIHGIMLPTLVPLFIRFFTIGGAAYYAMSAMTLFYIALTLIIAKRINITNKSLVELKEHFSRIAQES